MESKEKLTEEEKLNREREIARAYAKYLRDHNLAPGEKTVENTEPVNIEPKQAELPKKPKKIVNRNLAVERTIDRIEDVCAGPMFIVDKLQDKIADALFDFSKNLVDAVQKIVGSYNNSRRQIATAFLIVCVLCSVMLIIFDKFTVYEYAYNGKVLGYVGSQEDVTNVLDVATEQLNEVMTDKSQDIEFTANDNISFNLVRSAGKDTDDADTTINKLAYMTDVEVVASAIYDGQKLVTIVKSDKEAEELLAEVKAILGMPDDGMDLISTSFSKKLDIRPINVLLTSVQSRNVAKKQMTTGGEAKFYHLIEEGETLESVAKTFGVETSDIYNEDNTAILSYVEQGEKVCIHKVIEPVSVKMVEKGKMKEIVPFETIKKKSDKYYIGDEIVKQKGVNGVQIFEGTLTRIGGKVSKRKTVEMEVITKKKDKIIYVGTAPRPKTAPTGTFINPMRRGTYLVTSRPGWRWGRTHEGVDMASSVGTHVYAADGGVVVRSSYYGGYGYCIEIRHANGWLTRYGHLSYMGVHVGQKVYQGQYIGNVGSTGNSTGAHLHFETRKNGAFVNPDTQVRGGL